MTNIYPDANLVGSIFVGWLMSQTKPIYIMLTSQVLCNIRALLVSINNAWLPNQSLGIRIMIYCTLLMYHKKNIAYNDAK